MAASHARTSPFVTPEEYFDFEAEAERRGGRKSEYVDGRIRPMTENGVFHIRIHSNLVGLLIIASRGRPFKVLGPETPLRITAEGPYYYPDVIVAPRPPESHHADADLWPNPISLFEIVSPATPSSERGEKLMNCGRIETLRDYVVLAQDGIQIEHFSRDGDDHWQRTELDSPAATLTLAGIPVSMPLAAIYDGLEFDSPKQAENSE